MHCPPKSLKFQYNPKLKFSGAILDSQCMVRQPESAARRDSGCLSNTQSAFDVFDKKLVKNVLLKDEEEETSSQSRKLCKFESTTDRPSE